LPRHRSRMPRRLIGSAVRWLIRSFFASFQKIDTAQQDGGTDIEFSPKMKLLASDLACVRGGRQVFRNLSFGVSAGEALVVTGPNGVGKSSLLRLIAGLVRSTEGRLALEGGDSELTIGEQAHYLGHQDALK